ncbi:hypothetical protein [Pseudomonas sp. nanlin1]|uniref:hypothetical protein n=1 Tax=Pseudomonas sp. nanlin1 TaxID=3040605 RepID=UPI00388F5BB2
MKRQFAVLAIAIGLAGCAGQSMDHARAGQPYKTLTSAKSPQQVAQCSEFTWQNQDLFGSETEAFLHSASSGRLTVYTRGVEYFADIQPRAGATTVEFYVTAGQDGLADRRWAALATCL